MTSSTGVDTARAFALLNQVGWTPEQVAAELGVPAYSARRWAAGHLPPSRCLTGLRALVGQLLMVEQAAEALLTGDERAAAAARDAEIDAQVAANMRAARERGRVEEERCAAPVRELAEGQRRRRRTEIDAAVAAANRFTRAAQALPGSRSAYANVDPFALVGEPEPALPF